MGTRDWSWILVTTLVALMLKEVLTSSCPTVCHCQPVDRVSRDKTRMFNDCSNRSLESLPEHYSHHALKLNISFNRFSKLAADFFGKGSHDLRSVFLNNNSITAIAESTFRVLPSLWMLDLSGNKLETLEKYTFKNNTSLWSLILRGNNIKLPANTIFLEAPFLVRLDLSYNNLETLDDNTFLSMNKLKSLRLHNNRLNSLSKSWFRGLKNLHHLFLEDNNLHYLNPDTFVYTESLIELSLSRNNLMISSGQPFLRIHTLERLYLNGCNLTFLPGMMFEMMTRLRYLFVSNNRLRTLDYGMLVYFEDLVYLNACDNLLSCDCDLKDTWQWCKYRNIKADVNCGVSGQILEMCAGSWNVVGDLVCNATTTTITPITTTSTTKTSTESPPLSSPEAVSSESSNVGLFAGIGIALLLVVLIALGIGYWHYSTRRSSHPRQDPHMTTRLVDMLPFHNEQDEY
ncbi:phospholipase A2 inhibitor beta [Anabrus simplex]|uniref:phospholipase A2 inhibitor beta n=1 Tax=Anabrus simplex TaxID=316456 RepID=UPI0035A3419A